MHAPPGKCPLAYSIFRLKKAGCYLFVLFQISQLPYPALASGFPSAPSPLQEKSLDAKREKKITELVGQLGSPRFLDRQLATRQLWEIGKPAEEKIRAALKSPNAEVVARAASILSDFDYGIYPGIDRATRDRITRFRDGSLAVKTSAGKELLQSGMAETLVRLILRETDSEKAGILSRTFLGNSRFLQEMLIVDEARQALDTLRLLNQGAKRLPLDSMRLEQLRTEYIWLAQVQGQLGAEISSLEKRLQADKASGDPLLMVRLQRSAGRNSDCLATSKKISDREQADFVRANLLAEAHHWDQLSDRHWVENREPISEIQLSDLLNAITFHRLAAQRDRFEKDLNILYAFSDPLVNDLALDADSDLFDRVSNATIFKICEFLFANRQIEKALDYLQKTDKIGAFDAYVSIDDYEKAFAAIGLQEVSPATAAILERKIRSFRPARWSGSTREMEGFADIIHAFYQLGFHDQARDQYRALYSVALRFESKQQEALEIVCRSMLNNDQLELFFDLIQPQVAQKKQAFAIRSIFRELDFEVDGVSLADYWWTVLEDRFPERKPMERLRLLRDYLRPPLPGQNVAVEFTTLLELVEKEILADQGWGDEAFLGYTYLLLKQKDKAKSWFRKYLLEENTNRTGIAMQLGDLYREDRQYAEAASAYLAGWEQTDRRSVSALYLAGLSARLEGKPTEAKKWIRMARQCALSPDDHRQLAIDLYQRDLGQDALALLESTMKTADFQSWETGTARFRLINLLGEDEGQRAANLLENQLLDVAATPRLYTSMSSYTYYPVQVSLRQFDQCIHDQRPNEAYEAARRALAIRPCSATVAEDYLPRLRKLEKGKPLADKLLDSIIQSHQKQLKRFPESGLYHNNLAWACTTNGMHLEMALEHAEKVVRQEPQNPTYIDTLADICFNLGQRERAINLIQRCLQLNPASEHYRAQLKRFQQSSESRPGNR
ncbi:MAG: hypothetical protein VX768_01315 [Planctomycetota bacterium]|nr:hypothetical protein [Planctomycetota bacterium]